MLFRSDALALASYQSDPRYLEHYLESSDSQRIVQLARLWAAESPRLNFAVKKSVSSSGWLPPRALQQTPQIGLLPCYFATAASTTGGAA